MKRIVVLLAVLVAVACAEKQAPELPLSEAGEKLYPIRGVVVGRNVEFNSLRIDHEEIPGFMGAMTMDYTVRGTKVAALPADKSRFEAKLHVTDTSYWLTDVKQVR